MKKILVTLLAFVSLFAFASDDWVRMSETKTKDYFVDGKKNSFYKNEMAGFITTRSLQKGENFVFSVVGMSIDDCNAGMGKVYFYDTNMKFKYSMPYVSKGGTIAQTAGDLICDLIKRPNV